MITNMLKNCVGCCYFFLKCLIEFVAKPFRPGVFLVFLNVKVFSYEFNFLANLGLLRLSIFLCVSFGKLWLFKKFAHFLYIVEFVGINFI